MDCDTLALFRIYTVASGKIFGTARQSIHKINIQGATLGQFVTDRYRFVDSLSSVFIALRPGERYCSTAFTCGTRAEPGNDGLSKKRQGRQAARLLDGQSDPLGGESVDALSIGSCAFNQQ